MRPFFSWTIVLIVLTIFLFQCKKIQPTGQVNTGNQVTTTLCGLVLDENGIPLENVFVRCNNKNTMTTGQGIFILNQVSALENKTDIEITKDGYFKSFKTLLVKHGQQQFTKCVLLKKDNSQYFDANNGGNVSFGSQLSFNFPANALINKSTGLSYTGQAEMVVKYIDPTTNQGLLSMPGNLTALDSNENEKVLISYGMFVAEIYDQTGNILQIKPNKQVQFSLEIPVSMQPSASQTISLWYFDESKAIWVEEGSATLNGSKYVGQVNHFSFWNCDAPKDYIKLEMTIVDQNNFPVSGRPVRITDLSNGQKAGGTTDAKGWVGGMVPSNTNLKVEVLSPDICGAIPLYSLTFTTGSTAQNLGDIIVNIMGNTTCQIGGKLVNCNQTAVSNGMVYLEELQDVIFTNQYGNFSFTMPCTPSILTLYCHDISNNQFDSIILNPTPGINNLGNLNACGLSGKFLNLTVKKVNTVDSFSYSYFGHKDYLNCYISTNEPISTLFQIGLLGEPEKFILLDVSQIIKTGQYNVSDQMGYQFSGPENIFAEKFWDKDNLGTITVTSNSPYPGDVTGYFTIPMKGQTTNQDYLFYGDFRIPKYNDF